MTPKEKTAILWLFPIIRYKSFVPKIYDAFVKKVNRDIGADLLLGAKVYHAGDNDYYVWRRWALAYLNEKEQAFRQTNLASRLASVLMEEMDMLCFFAGGVSPIESRVR